MENANENCFCGLIKRAIPKQTLDVSDKISNIINGTPYHRILGLVKIDLGFDGSSDFDLNGHLIKNLNKFLLTSDAIELDYFFFL